MQSLFVDILYVNEVAGQDDASKTVSNEIRIITLQIESFEYDNWYSYSLAHENCNCLLNLNRSNKLLRKSYPLHLKNHDLVRYFER